MRIKCLTAILLLISGMYASAQQRTGYEKVKREIDTEALRSLQKRLSADWKKDSIKIEQFRERFGEEAVFQELEDGTVIRLAGFEDDGTPIYCQTDNANAAVSTNTVAVKPGGVSSYNLTGQGIVVGIWDGGDVLDTHQEFGNRVTLQDNAGSSSHATHVGGTIVGAGVNSNAEGMATHADLWSWTSSGDSPEMTGFAAQGNILSNHAYSTITGWRFNSSSGVWRWYGDTTVSTTEDYNYGRYSSKAELWDTIAFANPYYTIIKSAGNNRNNTGPGPGNPTHQIRHPQTNNWITSNAVRPPDCPGGYHCMASYTNAKNIIAVGAVEDVLNYTGPASVQMSSFSSWGPTDDGRLKPEITANGVSLFSADNGNNSDYSSKSGTSMSSPNVTGNIALIQDLHDNLYGTFLKSATIKALLIETAKEAGSGPEPDYAFGYGLMDTKAACDVVSRQHPADTIIESTLLQNDTFSFTVTLSGNYPVSASLAWTDPPGDANWPVVLNDTTPVLVNDLDIVIFDPQGNPHEPYVMDPANPSAPATTGNNRLDNAEKIYISAPASGTYTVRITHKSQLEHGAQDFSLVMSKSNIISCYTPFDITDVFIGTDNARLTWVSNSGASNWEYYAVPSGSSGQSAATVTGIDTAVLTGLTPETEYDFYVRDICAPGDTSDWSVVFTFRTACSAVPAPFTEDFEGGGWLSGTGSSNSGDAVDSCWSRNPDSSNEFFWGTRSGTTTSSTTGPSGDNTTGNGKYVFTEGSNGSQGDPARLTSPLIDMNGTVNPGLRYAYHMNGSNIETLYVKINNGTGWTTVSSIPGPVQTDESDPWLWDSVDLSSYVNDTVRIRFYTERGSSWRNDVCVDDVQIFNRFQNDLGVTEIFNPGDICASGNTEIGVVVNNFGVSPQSNFNIMLQLTGSSAITETANYFGTLDAGLSDTVLFTGINTLPGGQWQAEAYTVFPLDQYPDNDTAFLPNLTYKAIGTTPPFPVDTIRICESGDTMLVSNSGNDELQRWFDKDHNPVASGDSFLLSPSNHPDSIFADRVSKLTGSAGAPDNQIGSGGTFTSFTGQQIYFDVHEQVTIDSVTVYPGSSGTVGFRVRNSSGVTVFTNFESVSPSTSGAAVRIPVGAVLQPGTGYQIDAPGSSVSSLYRNSSGATYPYISDNGELTITGNSFSPDYYYFFYNWKVSSTGCEGERVKLIIDAKGPVVDLGADTGYCKGDTITVTLDAGNPGLDHNWNTGHGSRFITVDTAGVYSVTVTDSDNCTADDVITVNEFELPEVEVNDTLFCPGDSGELTAAGNFVRAVWSTGDSSASVVVYDHGSYTVTVTDASGCSNTAAGNVGHFSAPLVNLGSDRYIASGETVTLDAGNPGHDYIWSTGETTQTIVAGPGEYSVTVTNFNGCSDSDSVKVILDTSVPELFAGDVNFYPNPAGERLTIELNAVVSEKIKWEIFDASGKLLNAGSAGMNAGKNTIEIELAGIAPGMYLIKLSDEGRAPAVFKFSKL